MEMYACTAQQTTPDHIAPLCDPTAIEADRSQRLQIAYGSITVDTTGQNDPLLTGALCSICISAIVCTAVSSAIVLQLQPSAAAHPAELTAHALSLSHCEMALLCNAAC